MYIMEANNDSLKGLIKKIQKQKNYLLKGETTGAITVLKDVLHQKEHLSNEHIFDLLVELSICYWERGEINKGRNHIQEAYSIVKIMENDENRKARALLASGAYNWRIGKIKITENQINSAHEFYQRLDNQEGIGLTFLAKNLIYIEKGDLINAQKYNSLAKELFESIGKDIELAYTLHCLGIIHLNLNDPTKAKEVFLSSLNIFKEKQITSMKAILFYNIGKCHMLLEEFNEAENLLLQSIYIWESKKLPFNGFNIYEEYIISLIRNSDDSEQHKILVKNKFESLFNNLFGLIYRYSDEFRIRCQIAVGLHYTSLMIQRGSYSGIILPEIKKNEFIQEIIRNTNKLGHIELEIEALILQAKMYYGRGLAWKKKAFDGFEKLIENIKEYSKKNDLVKFYCETLIIIGSIRHAVSEIKEAIQAYEEARQVSIDNGLTKNVERLNEFLERLKKTKRSNSSSDNRDNLDFYGLWSEYLKSYISAFSTYMNTTVNTSLTKNFLFK